MLPTPELYEEDPKQAPAQVDGNGNKSDQKQQKLIEGGYGTARSGNLDKASTREKPPITGLSQELCDALIGILRGSREQAAIEDALSNQGKNTKFNAALRKQLETSLKDGKEIPEELKKSLIAEIKAGNIRPALLKKLDKLLSQSSSPADRVLLANELSGGLFKKDLIENILTEDAKAGRFGPASKAIWQTLVQGVENESTRLARLLVAGKSKYVDADAPFTADQYQKWLEAKEEHDRKLGPNAKAFENWLEEEKPEVKLGIDIDKIPDVQALSKLRDTIYWNAGEQLQVTAIERGLDQAEIAQLVATHKRNNWLPERTASTEEKDRRFNEIAGILGPAKTAEDTLGALKWVVEHREEAENLPWSDTIWNLGGRPLFAHNEWMLEAIRTFPGDRDSGLASVPKDLTDTLDNSDQKKKVAQWVEEYGQKTAESLGRLMVNIHTNGVLLYGVRDKVNEGDKSLISADKPKSLEGHDYNRVGYDFDVTRVVGPDGTVSYKVTQYTDCIQSSLYNLWDIGAARVDTKRQESTHMYKEDDLVPFSSGNQIFFVEPSRLADLHWREQNNLIAGKTGEVGLDAIFTLLPMARGGKLAAGVVAKQGFKGLVAAKVRNELVAHAGMSLLALAGGLNNATVRQTQYGPTALGVRSAAFITLVSRDLIKKMSSGAVESLKLGEAAAVEAKIGDATILLGGARPAAELAGATAAEGRVLASGERALATGETAGTLSSTGQASEHLPQVSIGNKRAEALYKGFVKADKPINRLDAVVQVAMFGHLGMDLLHHAERSLGIEEREQRKNNSGESIKEGREKFEKLANDLLVRSAQTALTTNVSPELAERINQTFAQGKESPIANNPEAKSQVYEQLTEGLGATTIQERVAAGISLLNLKEKLGLANSTEGYLLTSLRTELQHSQSATDKKDILTPQAELTVLQTLLAHENITSQQFALEVSRIANLPTTSAEGKMQAITNLGMAAWSAESVESTRNGDANYWSTNHGCSKADLEKQLRQISSGANGEKDPDVRAFATSVLYALRHGEESERLEHFNQAVSLWRNNFDAKASGTYGKAFVDHMRSEANLEVPNTTLGEARESLRARQYLAGIALTELGGPEAKEGFRALVHTIDQNAPSVTVRTLHYLAPHLQQLEEKDRNYAIDRTIQFLQKSNAGLAPDKAMVLDANKAQILKIIPELLSSTVNSAQFNKSAASLAKLIDRTPNNHRWFTHNADLRSLAVESLTAVHAFQAEPQMRELLKYKSDKSPVEPSPYARLAALEALKSWRSPALLEVSKEIVQNETDPRLKQEAQDIIDASKRQNTVSVTTTTSAEEQKYAEAEKFLKTNFPYIFKEAFDKELKRLTPEYSSLPLLREFDEFKYPEEIYADERVDWVRRQLKDIALIGRWAAGKFQPGENITENGEQKLIDGNSELANKVQREAINSLALFVGRRGLTANGSQPLLPEVGRREAIIISASALSRVARSATDPELRNLAASHLINLMQNKDVNPEAKLELLPGFRSLSSGAQTALLSKSEAAHTTIEALKNHRSGPWLVENIPESLRTQSQKTYKEAAWSAELQIALMKDITHRYQDREEGLPLLEEIAKESKIERVRAQAQECVLTLKGGVNLAYRAASMHPDQTTPLDKRADLMSSALDTADSNASRAINSLFQYAGGKPFSIANDPRLPILINGLDHDNHKIQLASALALVNNHATGPASHLAMRKLACLAATDSDPAIRQEARQKLDEIFRDVTKKQNDLAWRSTRPQGKTAQEKEQYKTKMADKAKEYASYLKDLSVLREQASKSAEGILFFFDFNVIKANSEPPRPLSPEKSIAELSRRGQAVDASSPNESKTIGQILSTGFRTEFALKGNDVATTKYRELLENDSDRISMAAASVLVFRNANQESFRLGIEKLAKLEANASSETLKKEAAILLDRSIDSLQEQVTANPRLSALIRLIETERARASGIPINL